LLLLSDPLVFTNFLSFSPPGLALDGEFLAVSTFYASSRSTLKEALAYSSVVGIPVYNFPPI
jgi:hypothetical protein